MSAETKGRGGSRPGAGRKPLPPGEKRTMQEIYLSPATWAAVSSYRTRHGITTSGAVEALILAGIEQLKQTTGGGH